MKKYIVQLLCLSLICYNVNAEEKKEIVEIKYNPNSLNLDGDKAISIPSQSPAGIPVSKEEIKEKIPEIESTVEILNTPNDKIRKIKKDLYNKGKVINELPTLPPRPNNGNILTLKLNPGSVPPVIRLSKNRTSAFILTDSMGQPWPILNYDGLSEEDFVVKRLDEAKGSVISVTPKGEFVTGNLVLVLMGLPTPIIIDFVSAQKEVDEMTQIRVQAKGPNSSYTTIGLPDTVDSKLLSILQGVPPSSSKELSVSTNAVQAWDAEDGFMYLRTRYKIMAPAFEQVSSSPDGTNAYKMVKVPVVLYNAGIGVYGEFIVGDN